MRKNKQTNKQQWSYISVPAYSEDSKVLHKWNGWALTLGQEADLPATPKRNIITLLLLIAKDCCEDQIFYKL